MDQQFFKLAEKYPLYFFLFEGAFTFETADQLFDTDADEYVMKFVVAEHDLINPHSSHFCKLLIKNGLPSTTFAPTVLPRYIARRHIAGFDFCPLIRITGFTYRYKMGLEKYVIFMHYKSHPEPKSQVVPLEVIEWHESRYAQDQGAIL